MVNTENKTLFLIIVFLSLFAIFSSNLFVSKSGYKGLGPFLSGIFGDDGDDQGEDDDNGNRGHGGDRKDREDILKKLQKAFKDRDKEDKEETKKEKSFVTRDYNFADEGKKKRKSFFAVAGDFGCSKNAKNTISNMKDKKPELVIPLGDLSYDKSANCWLDIISPFSHKLKVTLGYHDVNDGEQKLNQYKKTFALKNHYDSFDYGKVHFVIMSSSEFDKGSKQYKFISEDLKKASEDKEIDWIIVTSYGPFYTSHSKHTAEKDIRNIYHPL